MLKNIFDYDKDEYISFSEFLLCADIAEEIDKELIELQDHLIIFEEVFKYQDKYYKVTYESHDSGDTEYLDIDEVIPEEEVVTITRWIVKEEINED